jgi:hypothetical protein
MEDLARLSIPLGAIWAAICYLRSKFETSNDLKMLESSLTEGYGSVKI